MSRKIRCIAITLAFAALTAVSVQAAPTRTPPQESSPEVDRFINAWKGLVSWLREEAPTLVKISAESTSHLDPNGGNH
jgi:hypothetical protein